MDDFMKDSSRSADGVAYLVRRRMYECLLRVSRSGLAILAIASHSLIQRIVGVHWTIRGHTANLLFPAKYVFTRNVGTEYMLDPLITRLAQTCISCVNTIQM